jgi:hypothetical protein
MVEILPQDPNERVAEALRIRIRAAKNAGDLDDFPRPTNGDEERYQNRIGNFSKGLPHNDLGEVEPADYDALLNALRTGDFNDFEALRLGGQLMLLNPLGGLAFNIEGPDSPVPDVAPPPVFASAQIAAQMAELYWMAVCRDVPFADYDSDPTIGEAVADLTDFPGYEGPTPLTRQNLFRVDYPGVLDGPLVSQFLLKPFRYDGIPIEARTRVPLPVTSGEGIDFLTSYDEWLCAQRGFPLPDNPFGYPVCPIEEQRFDPDLRFIRSVRDMGQNAGQDIIYSAYFRAALILGGFGRDALDMGNPYRNSRTQGGFATFGIAHLLMLVGSVHKAERHTWYQKWNVHRFLRPEAFGGRVHNVKTGAAGYPVHERLLNSPVLDKIFDYNRLVNQRREIGNGEGSFLLPILFSRGSPTHPSFPAGHAVSAGACVTALKAWFNEDFPIPDPVKPSRDGLAVEPYEVGVDGPELTVGGELNKLAHNLSFGRDMSGVHWRADDIQGDFQGEEVTISILREARPTYPERFSAFTLTKFDGTTISV